MNTKPIYPHTDTHTLTPHAAPKSDEGGSVPPARQHNFAFCTQHSAVGTRRRQITWSRAKFYFDQMRRTVDAAPDVQFLINPKSEIQNPK